MVATVAAAHLTPTAQAQVARLLALEPGATLATVSTWADETRNRTTARWHYVNLPRDRGCTYDEIGACPDGACVVGTIERQGAILASKAPDAERLQALKYIVHFVADVHQPLHAGYADDKGGNSFQLQAYDRGTNLHALWDTAMIVNWPGGLPALQAAVEAAATRPDGTPGSWAGESCQIVGTNGFYPATHKLSAE